MNRYVIKRMSDGKYYSNKGVVFVDDISQALVYERKPTCAPQDEIAVKVEIKEVGE